MPYLSRLFLRAMTALSLGGLGVSSASADIVQDNANGGSAQINAYYPIGQSFTAVDPAISSIGFYILDYNPQDHPDDHDLMVMLFRSQGVGGPIVASATVDDIADGTNGFVDFDFSGTTLQLGSLYSAILYDDTNRWGLAFGQGSFLYAGGSLIQFGGIYTQQDTAFRVLAGPIPVNSAGSLPLALLAGLLLAAQRCRSNRRG